MDANMSIDDARGQRDLWIKWRDAELAERDEALAEGARHAKTAEGYQQMIDGLAVVVPGLASAPEPKGGAGTPGTAGGAGHAATGDKAASASNNGPEISLAVLQAHPGEWLTTDAFVALMGDRGWVSASESPKSSVRYALGKNVEAGHAEEKQFNGRTKAWRLVATSNADTPGATGVSGPATASGQGGDVHAQAEPLPSDRDHDLARRNGHRVDPSIAP